MLYRRLGASHGRMIGNAPPDHRRRNIYETARPEEIAMTADEQHPVFDETVYQTGYSAVFASFLFDRDLQAHKAEKAIAVLSDYLGADRLGKLRLLDIGCSVGLMTARYSETFGEVLGVDIDSPAVAHARECFTAPNLSFEVRDAMDTGLPAENFDVVTCAHIYEHVPDAQRLLDEIHRVLKPGGVCFFAAQNRFTLMEPHYRLPLLSVLPKPLADIYYRAAGKGDRYYEKLRSLGELRRLVQKFRIVDYTAEVIRDPAKYHATEMIAPGSVMQTVAHILIRRAYFLCPTYIWVLVKDSE
jgi:2-polyprenyl-3-methyl-5-hydroxy-6-metoxy-1,4-benzoquinol methylase